MLRDFCLFFFKCSPKKLNFVYHVRLRKFLYDKLIDCGFKDRLAQQCQDILKDRGLKNTSIDYLVDTVTPKARGLCLFLSSR